MANPGIDYCDATGKKEVGLWHQHRILWTASLSNRGPGSCPRLCNTTDDRFAAPMQALSCIVNNETIYAFQR